MTAELIIPATSAPAYRMFRARVLRLTRLSPSFLRVTFTGEDLADLADRGGDQRIQLLFPPPCGEYDDLGDDWYGGWVALPDDRRPPMRTYTVREARPAARELDVDMVLHGDAGPAARWANRARTGDPLAVVGPNARFEGDPGGGEFRRPPEGAPLVLAGDETAAPAIAAIQAGLPAATRGAALLEVPCAADALTLTAPAGVRITWLARDGAPHGTLLRPAVEAVIDRLSPAAPAGADPVDDADDEDELWEVPAGQPATTGVHAWLAGEAGVIRALRRHLVTERGIDRGAVAFMGYWRLGRAEE